MNKIDALELAYRVWSEEWDGHGAVVVLCRTGLFTYQELSEISGLSVPIVRTLTADRELPRYVFGDRFDPKTLDALLALLVHYINTGEVAHNLRQLIAPYTSKRVVSRLTGIPIAEL